MKKLRIAPDMSMNEQKARMIVNHTIDYVKDEESLRKWLLDQVTGVIIDDMVITYAWLTYGAALEYFKEATEK